MSALLLMKPLSYRGQMLIVVNLEVLKLADSYSWAYLDFFKKFPLIADPRGLCISIAPKTGVSPSQKADLLETGIA